MRLLHARTIQVEEFSEKETPPYAILSHTWGLEEVSFQQIHQADVTNRAGYAKIKGACQQAIRDRLDYVWVDTCCIDKTSSTELSEAINSMFRWYKDAVVCYAYLADVPSETDIQQPESAFETSRWWTRGWTLQELLAPSKLRFYGNRWGNALGSKIDLSAKIAGITGISESILKRQHQISKASIAKRMSWASSRETSRREDIAYCLLGIFGVNMPLLYGEGDKAFIRLQEEIMKDSDDQTLFAWTFSSPLSEPPELYGPFAPGPAAFHSAKDTIPDEMRELDKPYAMTNLGLQISLQIVHLARFDTPVATLSCRHETELQYLLGIPVRLHGNSSFSRYGTSWLELIRRDEMRAATAKTYYFLKNGSTNSLMPKNSPGFDAYLLGKLPSSSSKLCIWKVEPTSAYDSNKGIIRLTHDTIMIHLWDRRMEGFVVVLSQTNFDGAWYQADIEVFPDSARRPHDNTDPFRWKLRSDKLVLTVGSPRVIAGVGKVRLLDIEVSGTDLSTTES